MNDRFKFRVWYNNKFEYDCCIKNGLVFNTYKDSLSGDPVIQQYTGMEDRYGKEIFEGDIVQLEVANQSCGFGRFEVVFERCAYHLKKIEVNWMIPDNTNIHTTLLGMYNICCVIGNIFENPEFTK